jgi:hypothetical protein
MKKQNEPKPKKPGKKPSQTEKNRAKPEKTKPNWKNRAKPV